MRDDDKALLYKWRERRGNKFLTLTTARELEKLDKQYAHLNKEST